MAARAHGLTREGGLLRPPPGMSAAQQRAAVVEAAEAALPAGLPAEQREAAVAAVLADLQRTNAAAVDGLKAEYGLAGAAAVRRAQCSAVSTGLEQLAPGLNCSKLPPGWRGRARRDA
jgi:hypothetical protein